MKRIVLITLAALLVATTSWAGLATITVRKTYVSGELSTAADKNADESYIVSALNQIAPYFPGDSLKVFIVSTDSLVANSIGKIVICAPLASVSAQDSLLFHLASVRRVNADSLYIGGKPIVAFSDGATAGYRAFRSYLVADSLRVVDSLTVMAGAKANFAPGSVVTAGGIDVDTLKNGVRVEGTAAFTGPVTSALAPAFSTGLTAAHATIGILATTGKTTLGNAAGDSVVFTASKIYLATPTITATGTVIFNNTIAGNYALQLRNGSTTPYGLLLEYYGAAPAGAGNNFIACEDTVAGLTRQLLVVASDGDVTNKDNSYGQISDSTVKQNIEDAPDARAFVAAVKMHQFEFKDDPGVKRLGVVAQELQEIAPELVSPHVVMRDTIIEDAKGKRDTLMVPADTLLSVNYMGLLVKALPVTQSNTERIEALDQVVAGLVGTVGLLGAAVVFLLAQNRKRLAEINDLRTRLAKLDGGDDKPVAEDTAPAVGGA
jgi:hypothetical protein